MDTKLASRLIGSRAMSLISGVFFSILWGYFAYKHLLAFRDTGDFSLLLFVIAETLAASFFIFRSSPKSVSISSYDWFIAVAGTFAAMFFTPTDSGIIPGASNAIIVGLFIQILALSSLNRSFAIVAAIRSIKTDKMYQFVRHPIYFSYCITFTGYVLAHTSYNNFLVYVTVIILLLLRIFKEEQHLSMEASYRDYMTRVRYRLIPFIF